MIDRAKRSVAATHARAHARETNGEEFMILNESALRWNNEVRSMALNHGWMAYDQAIHNQRQHDPSMILIRGTRVILAYLRTGRPRVEPPVDRFADVAGVEVYVWHPRDRSTMTRILISPPNTPQEGPR